MRACVASLGLDLNGDEAEALLVLYDADKSGTIDLVELAGIVRDLEALTQRSAAAGGQGLADLEC